MTSPNASPDSPVLRVDVSHFVPGALLRKLVVFLSVLGVLVWIFMGLMIGLYLIEKPDPSWLPLGIEVAVLFVAATVVVAWPSDVDRIRDRRRWLVNADRVRVRADAKMDRYFDDRASAGRPQKNDPNLPAAAKVLSLLVGNGGGAGSFEPQRDATLAAGRRVAGRSARDLRRGDVRKPVVYLPSPTDGQPTPAVSSDGGGITLEHLITEAGSLLGPVVAIGKPGGLLVMAEARQPAATAGPDEVQAIVIVIGGSPEVPWEAARLAGTGLLARTVFVLPPLPATERQELWRGFLRRVGAEPAFAPLAGLDPGRTVALVFDRGAMPVALEARRPAAAAYECALQFALAHILRCNESPRGESAVLTAEDFTALPAGEWAALPHKGWLQRAREGLGGIVLLCAMGLGCVALGSVLFWWRLKSRGAIR